MVLTSLWNWVIERVAYRPLRGSFRLAPLISAIGMSIFLSNFVQVDAGPAQQVGAADGPGRDRHAGTGGYTVTLSYKQIIIVGVTAVLLAAFWYVVQKTRSAARNAPASRTENGGAARRRRRSHDLDDIRHRRRARRRRRHSLHDVLRRREFADGFVPGVKAFTAAVLGGIGSLPGAVLGGLLIGLIETLWSAYFSTDYKDVAAFSILAITLIFVPSGLLGRPDVEKV